MRLMFIAMMACNKQDKDPNEEEPEEIEEAGPELTLQLETSNVVAGEEIPYTLVFTDPDNNPIEFTTWELSSNSEVAMFWSNQNIRPTLSGDHTIVVSIDHQGSTYTSEVAINVQPASPSEIDLVIDSYAVAAGETINAQAVAEDRYGNVVPDVEINIESNHPDVSIDDTGINTTVAGYYTLTASFEELLDIEYITIYPGPAVDIDLIVPNGDIELNQSIHCDVVVVDQYGNESESPWTLSVVGGQTTIYHNSISFLAEDEYTIFVALDGTTLSDSYGPFVVDSTGPMLEIHSPDRGASSGLNTYEVSGTVSEFPSSLTTTTINGTAFTVDSSGAFATQINSDFGLNLIETVVEDSDGNVSTDTRSILVGDSWPKDSGIDDAINVYIGSAGIETIEEYALELFWGIDLMDYIPSGGVNEELLGCDINANITSATYSGTAIEISPSANGSITVTFTLDDIYVDIDTTLSGPIWNLLCDINADGSFTASSIDVVITTEPNVVNNIIDFGDPNTINSSASVNGLSVNMESWLVNLFTGFFEDNIQGVLETALQDEVKSTVPTVLEALLQDLQLYETFDIMGDTYTLTAVPSSITLDNDGINLGLKSNIVSDGWRLSNTGNGSLYGNFSAPSFAGNSSVNIGISMDVINQLLYQLWGSDVIGQEILLSTLGLNNNDLDLVFPGANDLRVKIEPLLPPVAAENANELELQAGGIYVALHNGEYAENDIRLEVYAQLFSPFEIQVGYCSDPTITDQSTCEQTGVCSNPIYTNFMDCELGQPYTWQAEVWTDNAISTEIGSPVTYFDIVYPSDGADAVETIFDIVLPIILPSLTDAIGQIALPTFQGFTISNLTSTTSNGQIKMTGTLSN